LVLSALVGFAASPALATPRYSMRIGQKCNLCHANPTGGGQRDPYASQYLLPTRLAMQLQEEPPATPDPQIGESVTLGADLRTFFLKSDAAGARENFVEMQASVYLKLQLDPRFSAYVHQEFGAGRFGGGSAEAWEIYGMGYVLPGNGYVKIGKFVPAFGWKTPDHRSFTRREFVFLPRFPPHSDTGIEIGTHPGPFVINASIVNGAAQSAFDNNDEVAFVGRGAWRSTFRGVNAVVGGSYYYDSGTAEKRQAGGPFAGLHWKKLTWLGEFDWGWREPSASGSISSFTTTNELAVQLVQGLDVVGTYDFHDPDLDFQSGAVHRVGGGAEALLFPFLALRAVLSFYSVDDGPAVGELGFSDDFKEGHVQVQFLY
jgi:hypothetical protein